MKYLYFLLIVLIAPLGFAQSNFLKTPENNPQRSQGNIIPVTATIGYQGYEESQEYFGQGEYEIFLDNVNGVLDQPIILLDGFDPGDQRDITSLYNTLDFGTGNIADVLRDEGYDIVILNAPQYVASGIPIDGGSDYIQRNAFVLVELINQMNAQKVGDEELVVLGPSMGGLIARYALAYMEQNSLDAETRLYISLDAPHVGANIPIALQYMINYLAEEGGDTTAQALVNAVLNSPAAREMLIDHYLAHLLAGSTFEQDPTKLLPEGAPNFRDAFQGELDALGFPQNVRNVAIINGAGDGSGTGTPGMQVVNTTLDLDTFTSVDVLLRFTPNAGQTNTVTDLETFFIGIPVASYTTDAESPSESAGLDSAPGGIASITEALGDGGGNPVIIDFINAIEQDEYAFIPTLSALAINTEPNWYAPVNISESPFVNIYIPTTNELHVTITPESAQFALDEIRDEVLSTDEIKLANAFELERNPVDEKILLRRVSATPSEKVMVEIFNLSGATVYSEEINNAATRLEIENTLTSGMYLLNITLESGTETHKLLVR